MHRAWPALLLVGMLACQTPHYATDQLRNSTIREHVFLPAMRADAHYSGQVVNRCEDLLIHLCFDIEAEEVTEAAQLYPLVHHTITEMNKQLIDFEREGIMLDSTARVALAAEFTFIANAYGIAADEQELMRPAAW
ncbi:MAG: hypothetical protein H6591_04620 [Flavobacteriales bacterium]|nr:hypothetical protein [Flavobacteriales bacterium]